MGPLSGKRFFAILVASFAVVFAVNGYMIAQAVKTFSGEASSSFGGQSEADEYLQGVHYNEVLARRATQKALGWRADISALRDKGGAMHVVLDVKRRDGTPVSGLTLRGVLRHPSDASRDHPLVFAAVAPGRYAALLGRVMPGQWTIELRSGPKNPPFEASCDMWLR